MRPDSEVVSRKLGDRLVVVNLRTNSIYELNRTASRLWELLEAGSSRAQLEDALVEEFDAERSVVSRDVDEAIAKLSAEGLLVEREAA